MSLAGAAVVAIWNDITDEGRANFYEWHNREHMPERAWCMDQGCRRIDPNPVWG